MILRKFALLSKTFEKLLVFHRYSRQKSVSNSCEISHVNSGLTGFDSNFDRRS